MSCLLHEAHRAGWVFSLFIALATAVVASEPSLVISFTNERLEFGPGDIVRALPVFPEKNVPAIAFQMSAEKAREFGALTARHIGEKVDLVVCGKVIFSPLIKTPILSGSGVIKSTLSLEEATKMAAYLQRGTCQ
jgi:preprotein translocase subunit SecD